ncbi:MAG TPA: NADH-quinone oxidoreductase subunit N, partial [Gemmataceae bacterium]
MFLTSALLEQLQSDLSRDLRAFLPELILCGTIVAMLLARLFARVHLVPFALATSVLALLVALAQWQGSPTFDPRAGLSDPSPIPLFTGLLLYDGFAVFARVLLLSFLVLLLALCLLSRIPDREDSADFATLLLGSTLGMMLMVASNHLLTVFIAVEMASVPSYVLAGFLKGRRQGSEAALKYVIFGAAAAGVMLYGISLITARFGTGYLPELALGYAAVAQAGSGLDAALIAGTLFVLVGLGFKLAAVPFHFWCPDVFEGAAAEVGAFLSVASKAAAVVLLARLVLLVGPVLGPPAMLTLAGFAAVTATFGNLAAFAQTNLKRLLAYSTIAHAGYMLMGVALVNALGVQAVLFYLVAYLLMNLGAFAAVALIRNRTGSEDLSACAGLVYRSPVLVVTLTLFLLSLLGLPPLAGFAAKVQILAALLETSRQFGAAGQGALGNVYLTLVALLVLNTVLS